MTTSYKTKVRVTQQYQQVRHETYRIMRDGDPSTIRDNLSDNFSFLANSGEVPRNMPAMNTVWEKLPFAYPENKENIQNSVKINEILSFSLRQQIEDEVSNNAGFVVVLTSRCLSAIGIDNQVDSGYRQLHGESLPHIWLIIEGYVIDNTFINELSEEGTKYLSKHTPKCYHSSDFSYPEANIPNLKNTISFEILEMRNIIKKRLVFYRQKPDRALALGLNGEQAFNYYFSMTRHMYDVYGVCITGIDPKIRFMCWWCECFPKSGKHFLSDILGSCDIKEAKSSSKSTWKFSHCSRCMVASYCSSQCQRSDWVECHKITCFSRGSVYLPPLGDVPFISDTL